ncbi:MAG TPA: aldehyde dehydrogenase family protein [Saprospiraceae bacterium]|nr:aldehyde dehydrogenase family protein [Saprospiraceae bacterium]HQW57194.1 aldehyde dehydrogenase family protein [Saprospiraceae bacterium]
MSLSTSYISINPYTGEQLATFKTWSQRTVQNALRLSAKSYEVWSNMEVNTRLRYLRSLAVVLEQRLDTLAQTITLETGKPITQSRAEVRKSIVLCQYYIDHTEEILKGRKIKLDKKKYAKVAYFPQGIILGVMPWNYPVWQVLRFTIPIIAGGNVVVVKQAKNTGLTATMLDEIFQVAFGDLMVFQSFFIDHESVDTVMKHSSVSGVSVTGSERAGIEVSMKAGKYLKKCVMELGGSDAFVVLKGADVPLAATVAARARLNNNGQTCIAAKRFIVDHRVIQTFTELFVDAVSSYKIGPPMEEDSELSVLARADLGRQLAQQVAKTIRMGGKFLLKGGIDDEVSACYHPQILHQVSEKSPAYKEELFGPVATLIVADNTAHAIQLANDTRFGLGASVWSENIKKAHEVAARLEVGSVAINQQLSSDPRVPFGGVKASGHGREMSAEGMIEFLNTKAIIIPAKKKGK